MMSASLIAVWTFSILLLFGLIALSKSLLSWQKTLTEVQESLAEYKDSLIAEDKKLVEQYKEFAERIKEFTNNKRINDEVIKTQLHNVYHGLLDLRASSENLIKQLDPYTDTKAIENIKGNIEKIQLSLDLLDEQPGFSYKPFNKVYFEEKFDFSKN